MSPDPSLPHDEDAGHERDDGGGRRERGEQPCGRGGAAGCAVRRNAAAAAAAVSGTLRPGLPVERVAEQPAQLVVAR